MKALPLVFVAVMVTAESVRSQDEVIYLISVAVILIQGTMILVPFLDLRPKQAARISASWPMVGKSLRRAATCAGSSVGQSGNFGFWILDFGFWILRGVVADADLGLLGGGRGGGLELWA